ncbi:hypothetical protein N7455_000818 [Penicillium solitum]|uniref:uncharacterized protein n=1 Tax=Penicillium solitum TaxID=60172 RepID=UPI0032C48AB5|nr:hypothetical protein N7455_000818 [Penicillium solitum]
MSAHHTRQRLPISCEPCRVRKIRCPRDGPACGTCIRRRVPLEQCVYSTRRNPRIPSQPQPEPQQFQPQPRSLENRSSCPDAPVEQRYEGVAGEPNADLVARIEKLEKLLHAKNKNQETEQEKAQETVPPPPNVPQLDLEVEGRRISEPVTAIATGTLIPSASGHVRFLPVTSGRRIFHRVSQESPFPSQESAMIDTPSGPFPFGEHDAENRHNLLAKLPPTEYCNQLKDLYFKSIAPALLTLIYGIHHSHGQTWTLLGLVHHLALSIGCHVDPSTFSLDIVEAEERRRCWLGLVTLLCNQNMAITGLDIYQSVFSSRVLPPAEVWDEDIVQGQPAPIETSADINPVSYLIRKSRLFQISSEICDPDLAPRPDDPTTLQRLDAAIRVDLDTLEQSYASILEGSSSIVHTNLLLSFAHHLVLILHSNILNEGTFFLPQYSWSKHCCMKSAQRVLELHADFHKLPQFTPFYWYIRGRGAFHAFHAAFVLVLALSMEPQEPCAPNVAQLLHECHSRLEASKEQSQLCTRTATILGQMLSSRWMTASGLVLDELQSTPLQSAKSNSQMNPISQPVDLSNGHVSSSESAGFPSLVWQIEPQQWINPVDMDWDQWDMIMNSMGNTS